MEQRMSDAANGNGRLDIERANTIRAGVFGVQDGIVSTFGLIMGVAGAQISPEAVVVAGVAGVVSGALSMGAGEYVSVRTQRELMAAGRAVDDHENVNPFRAAGANALLFIAGGLVPLLPFLLSAGRPAVITSIVLSALFLFVTGAVLTRLTRRSPVQSGLRMLIIGGGAGLLAYLVGSALGAAIT
jgi:VIT1/CCC1 family predicted Fe2+/Mn2+ transporter